MKKGIFFIAITLCLLAAACTPEGHGPLPAALAALQSDNDVLCSHVPVAAWDNDSYYVFQPKAAAAATALVFYGGATIDARAYAPMAHEIARAGYMTVLVKMPNDSAMRAPERAGEVMAAFPDIAAWAIGGHSMGGISACRFASEHPAEISAVVLWASYPSARNRLNEADLKALSVSATNDGIYPPPIIEKSRAMLPPDTQYVVIDGGNHGQFAWCAGDFAPADHDATIPLEQQSAAAVSATVQFLGGL